MAATWLLLGTAECRSTIGQDRVQPVGRANRARAMRNVLLAAPVAANPQPIVDQIRGHLEPMLKVELSFVNRAADLSHDERRALVAASVKWLDEFLVEFVEKQDPNEQQMLIHRMQGVLIGGERNPTDPRESIQLGVAKVVAATLPTEKAAAYESECAKRDRFYRDVALVNLVQCIGEKLMLSVEQRRSILDALNENWGTSSIPPVEIYMVSTNALPNVAEMLIRSELSASQQNLLDHMGNLPAQMFFGGSVLGAAGEVIDDIDLDVQSPAGNNEPPD